MAKLPKDIEQLINKVGNDLLPENHPLAVCDPDSPQFQSTLREYDELRTKGELNHPLLSGCEISLPNGYFVKWNSMWKAFIVSHPEIASCVEDFNTFDEAMNHAVCG